MDYRIRLAFMSTNRFVREETGGNVGGAAQQGLKMFAMRCLPVRAQDFVMECEGRWAKIWMSIQRFDQVLSVEQERIIGRWCYAFALFDTVFRIGVDPRLPLVSPALCRSVDAILALAEEPWLTDISELFNEFLTHCPRLLGQPSVLGPTFKGSVDVGGADADVLAGQCLVEIKSGVSKPQWRKWLYQLVGYTLLDYDDEYGINSVAFYLARRGWLIEWPLEELVSVLSVSGGSYGLADLRSSLQDVMFSI